MTMKQYICILACSLCITAHGSAKQETCTVTVLDKNANPVAGAEVAVYETVYAYMQGQVRLNLLGQIQKTKHDGTLSVSWGENKNDIIILLIKVHCNE